MQILPQAEMPVKTIPQNPLTAKTYANCLSRTIRRLQRQREAIADRIEKLSAVRDRMVAA